MANHRVRLIFTDLDGTLLDHDTYAWSPAEPALNLTKELRIPVIPCTSKTLAECLVLQKQLGLAGPLIFENGAGVALPKATFDRPTQHLESETEHHWICGFTSNYDSIRQRLQDVKKYGRYVFKSFGDMNVNEVAAATDLPLERAALAKKRLFTEPIQWLDDAKSFNQFHRDIKAAGLSLVRGGRFIHVLEDCDKGQTMQWLVRRFDPMSQYSTWTIALGDSPNDIPMLQAADVAVIIKNPHRAALEYVAAARQQVIRTKQAGPTGWNTAITKLLTEESVHG